MRLNDTAHLPQRLGELHVAEYLHAAAVRCTAGILLMASVVTGRSLSPMS